MVLGGRRAVTEAIRAGRAQRVVILAGARESEGLRALLDAARREGLEPDPVSLEEMERLGVPDHQGVAAFVAVPEEIDDRAFSTMNFDREALVVILDGIVDPQNFGACARSSEAAGAAMLVTRKRRAAPLSTAAFRASAGALLHLPVARVTNLTRAIEGLKESGFFVAGLDQTADSGIHDVDPPPRPLALVVGAEETGMSRLVRDACDQLVSIPMAGRTRSLNASAALGVGLFGFALRPR
jgi:23S rRNA (guanosine2251-2'-O)-methyltransferase